MENRRYVVVDITGRLSKDYDNPQEARQWMDQHNKFSGDCVMWEKVYEGLTLIKNLVSTNLFAIRKNGEWIYGPSDQRNDAIYHACRLTFNAAGGKEADWPMVLHALRQGLAMEKFMTYRLTPEDLEQRPALRELMDKLQEARVA